MPAFRFKLEPVLRQRQIAEDLAQRDLAKVLRQRMILHDQLRTMQRTITESKAALGDTLIGKVDMDRVGQFARYSGQETSRARTIVAHLAGLEKQIAVAREKLIAATRDRKVIERLKERHRRKWKQAMERREAAELDEIGVGQFAYRLVANAPA